VDQGALASGKISLDAQKILRLRRGKLTKDGEEIFQEEEEPRGLGKEFKLREIGKGEEIPHPPRKKKWSKRSGEENMGGDGDSFCIQGRDKVQRERPL